MEGFAGGPPKILPLATPGWRCCELAPTKRISDAAKRKSAVQRHFLATYPSAWKALLGFPPSVALKTTRAVQLLRCCARNRSNFRFWPPARKDVGDGARGACCSTQQM
jgi:hypothetical protein